MNNLIEKLRSTMLHKFSVKQNNTAANVVMFAGLMINTLEILNNPVGWNWGVTVFSTILVVIGALYQAVIIRCPCCGDKLKGKVNKLPDRCPECGCDLNKVPQE